MNDATQPVAVTLMESPKPRETHHSRQPRPQLEKIENRLRNIGQGAPTDQSFAQHPPAQSAPHSSRFIDLDPTLSLTSRATRIDRLIRAVAAQLGSVSDPRFQKWLALAASRQVPAASDAIVRETLNVVADWSNLRPIADLAQAEPSSLSSRIAFTYNWPLQLGRTILFHGIADLLDLTPRRRPRLIQISHVRVPLAFEKIRFQLAALALAAQSPSPVTISEGWLVRYDPDATTELVHITQLDASAATTAVDDWLASST